MAFRKSILILFFLFLASCPGGSNQVSITSQTLSNQGLQFLTTLAQQLEKDLSGSSDCSQFQQVLNNLVGTQNCSVTGSQSLGISQSVCTDTPSFNGQTSISFTFQNCQEPGQTLGGTVQMDIDWDGSILTDQVQTSDFSFNGLFYSIQNLTMEIDSNGSPTCSGVLLIQGQICGVTPDCNFCPLR
jgi:hypothetical protein